MVEGATAESPLIPSLKTYQRRTLQILSSLLLLCLCGVAIFSYSVHRSSVKSALVADSDSEFDPANLYTAAKNIDWDHPNRIDDYGCLFSSCGSDDESETILTRGDVVICAYAGPSH